MVEVHRAVGPVRAGHSGEIHTIHHQCDVGSWIAIWQGDDVGPDAPPGLVVPWRQVDVQFAERLQIGVGVDMVS